MHVTRLAAGIEAARTRHEMLELNRAGNFAGASSLASAGAALLSRLAPDDAQVCGVVASLQADIPHVAAQMDPLLMKRMHSASSSARKMRDADGRARRGTQRVECQAREADGHLFVELPDCGPFLLATGCPLTLADDRFELLGRPFVFLPQAPPAFLRSPAAPVGFSLDDIRHQVRAPMVGLLGMDVLQHYFWTLDMGRGVMTLSTERLDPLGSAVPFNTFGGVPLVPVRVEGRSEDAFVDTGAWLSYMPASEAAGASPVDTRHDFIVSPAPMHFTTAVYEKTLTLAGAELTGQFGVLPSEVPLPQAAKRRWILGAGLLSRRPLSFDPNGVMTFGHEP
jgi:hypothetical protein